MDFRFSLYFVIAIVTAIPLTVAISRYRKYQLTEYAYFIAFWSSGVLVATMVGLDQYSDNLLYWKIRETSAVLFFGMVYFQALRVIQFSSNIKYRKFVWLGILNMILIEILILSWNFIDINTNNPIFNLPETPLITEVEVGLVINGTVIYSTSYLWVRLIFGIMAFWTFLYAYFTINIVSTNARVIKAHILWRLAAIFGLLFNTFQWLPSFIDLNSDLQSIFAFFSIALVAIIAVFYPEGYLISEPQITRILDIYNLIEEPTENMFAKLQMDENELYQYLMEAKKKLEE